MAALRSIVAIGLSLAIQGCAGPADPVVDRQDAAANDPAAMMRIGEAAEASGDLSTADGFYLRASGLDGADASPGLARSRVLAKQGDMAGALALLRETHLRHSDDASVTAALGRMLIAQARPAEALTVFDAGLGSQPASVPLLVGKGVALDMTGRHAQAQEAYQAALVADPDNAAAHNNLELSRKKQKDAR